MLKLFGAWQHLHFMPYAVIKRVDSLRGITDSMFPEARKFGHFSISIMPHRSTLSDANARRPEGIFEAAYNLYATYKDRLSSDSSSHKVSKWMKRLQIIDSTTVAVLQPHFVRPPILISCKVRPFPACTGQTDGR